MHLKSRLFAAGLAFAVSAAPAFAADQVGYQIGSGNTNTQAVDPSHGLPVNLVSGSVTASFSGFTPTAGAVANLSVSTTSADVALPAGTTVVVTNTGSTDAAFRIQAGAGTALTTDQVIKAGAAIGLAPGSATHLSAITASGTTTLNIQGGAGGAAGYGGGGSGGGGAVTIASGADAVEGATTDTSSTNTVFGNLQAIKSAATGAIPAGANTIGKVGIDQTTPGTTNGTQDAADGSTAATVPARAQYAGAQSGGNLVGIIQASASAFLNMTTATTTKVITGSASKKVYVTAFRLHAGGTTTAKFVEGTGTNCATGAADLSETFDFAASDGSNQGNGLGPVLVAATAGDDVCVTNSAAQNLRVGVAYEIH